MFQIPRRLRGLNPRRRQLMPPLLYCFLPSTATVIDSYTVLPFVVVADFYCRRLILTSIMLFSSTTIAVIFISCYLYLLHLQQLFITTEFEFKDLSKSLLLLCLTISKISAFAEFGDLSKPSYTQLGNYKILTTQIRLKLTGNLSNP